MGYVEILFRTLANPRGGLKAMGKKLARRYTQHWWKHASRQDLEDVKIYEVVRLTVSNNFASSFEILLVETTARIRLSPFMLAAARPGQVWV